jgi:type I restriction enzyme, S subunit
MSNLPPGWARASTLDIVTLHDSRRVPLNAKQRDAMRGEYPYYGANGLVDHVNDYLFDGEYTLLAEDGGYFDDPKRGVAYEASGKFWVNNHAHILEPLGGIPNRFLRHVLNSLDWMPYVGGTTRLKLTQGGLQQAQVPLPPLGEQLRIVAKIDSLAIKSRRARDQLDHVSRLVEKYKRAILAAAFQGDLTRDLRLNSNDVWDEISVGDLFEWSSGKNLPSKRQAGGSIPVIGGNGVSGYHDTALIDFPTLVVGRVGAQCGNVHRSEGPAWITDNAIYATSIAERIALEFAILFFRVSNLNSLAGGTGQPYVNQTVLNELVMPVPLAEEQRQLVRRVDTAFAWIDRLATEATSARKLIDRLDQAVLGKAFQGELVPQDPTDEPASALLERIRSGRALSAAPVRNGSKPKRASRV